jgi:hypothetical protein
MFVDYAGKKLHTIIIKINEILTKKNSHLRLASQVPVRVIIPSDSP